jgi:hypothetical protein
MTGLQTMRKFRCPFGICVILSIALVFGCDLLCDLGLVSISAPHPSPITVSSGHSHEDMDDDHSSNHHDSKKDSHDHGDAEHSHESTDEEGCCDDLTQQFYSSLVSTSGTQNTFLVHSEVHKLISILAVSDLIESSVEGNIPLRSKFEHKPNGPPGSTGQNIRVLYCSFLI